MSRGARRALCAVPRLRCALVVVDSLAHGYSRMKQLMTDLVIVLFAMDDMAAWQLFTMLASDSETSRIPVTTWTIRPELRTFGDVFARPTRSSQSGAVRMR